VFPRQQISAEAEVRSIKYPMHITWPLISLPDHWCYKWI